MPEYVHRKHSPVNHIADPEAGTVCGKADLLMDRVQYRDAGGRYLCDKCEEEYHRRLKEPNSHERPER